MIKAIIFDFDGTLVKSLDIKTMAFIELYKDYGESVTSKVVKHHLLNGGLSRYEKFKFYHKQFLGKDLSKGDIEYMSNYFSDFVVDKVIQAPYVEGALEFLHEKTNYFDFYISTGTPSKEIMSILKKREILNFFTDVYGSPEEKTQHIKNIINLGKYKQKEIVYIGDSMIDYESAIYSNIGFIGIRSNENKFPSDTIQINNINELNKILKTHF